MNYFSSRKISCGDEKCRSVVARKKEMPSNNNHDPQENSFFCLLPPKNFRVKLYSVKCRLSNYLFVSTWVTHSVRNVVCNMWHKICNIIYIQGFSRAMVTYGKRISEQSGYAFQKSFFLVKNQLVKCKILHSVQTVRDRAKTFITNLAERTIYNEKLPDRIFLSSVVWAWEERENHFCFPASHVKVCDSPAKLKY